MIEFDVLRMKDGRLVLAHDFEDAQRREPPTLDEGLDHFAEEAYADVELDVDLKVPGYEREVVEGLRARGLADRVLISSQFESRCAGAAGAVDPARLVGAEGLAGLHEVVAAARGARLARGGEAASARACGGGDLGRARSTR